jgi:hypothetical protein
VPERVALTGIVFVLKTGIRREYYPQEFGCYGMTLWRLWDCGAPDATDRGKPGPHCHILTDRGGTPLDPTAAAMTVAVGVPAGLLVGLAAARLGAWLARVGRSEEPVISVSRRGGYDLPAVPTFGRGRAS